MISASTIFVAGKGSNFKLKHYHSKADESQAYHFMTYLRGKLLFIGISNYHPSSVKSPLYYALYETNTDRVLDDIKMKIL